MQNQQNLVKVSDIKPYPKNAKKHPEKQIIQVANSIKEFGFNQPIVIDKEGVIIVGHGRFEAAKHLGMTEVPVIQLDLTDEQAKAYRLADNKLNESGWEMDLVIEELKELSLPMLNLTGFDPLLLEDEKYGNYTSGSISERYVIAPFSVLDARQGKWQDRKREWLALGIQSDAGRSDDLLGAGLRELAKKQNTEYKTGVGITGTSIFDPVLAEISYKWFCPKGGKIVDPFCGGSVRGIVASKLGHDYAGTELSKDQVEANKAQGVVIVKEGEPMPNWICDDALNIGKHLKQEYDMLFTCPPYADLEVYSDDPRDISNMPYADFMKAYREIIKNSTALLKDDRFAVIVIGEVRGKDGEYVNFVGDTIQAFKDAGLHYYNEAILVTMLGTLPLRINKQFLSGRKIGKTHQNVLVFWKGDPKNINKTVADWEIEAWNPAEYDGEMDDSVLDL